MNLPMCVSRRTSIGPVKVVRHRVVPQFESTGFWEAETFSKEDNFSSSSLGHHHRYSPPQLMFASRYLLASAKVQA